jgi:hypothetical protein
MWRETVTVFPHQLTSAYSEDAPHMLTAAGVARISDWQSCSYPEAEEVNEVAFFLALNGWNGGWEGRLLCRTEQAGDCLDYHTVVCLLGLIFVELQVA